MGNDARRTPRGIRVIFNEPATPSSLIPVKSRSSAVNAPREVNKSFNLRRWLSTIHRFFNFSIFLVLTQLSAVPPAAYLRPFRFLLRVISLARAITVEI